MAKRNESSKPLKGARLGKKDTSKSLDRRDKPSLPSRNMKTGKSPKPSVSLTERTSKLENDYARLMRDYVPPVPVFLSPSPTSVEPRTFTTYSAYEAPISS
jgi:hypothetical protein